MVAAWINALTGDGPAMASGNQVCSGIWADFPIPPISNNKAIHVIFDSPLAKRSGASVRISDIFNVESSLNNKNKPMAIAVSPIRVIINAFLAALELTGFSYQKPINK